MANVTTAPPVVSMQCTYESWNTTTNCWNYRSCRDCLKTSGCMIGNNGMCREVGTATAQHNYTRAFAFNLTLPAAKDMNISMKRVTQEWEFPAFSVRYCAVDDAICTHCIQEKFWMNGMFDSRFCVGTNGCVCISACEFEQWNPSCPEDPNSGNFNSSSQPTYPPVKILPTYEECKYAYQDPITKCYQLRSCPDCLTKTGCRIGMDGACEVDSYENYDSPQEFDYRRAFQYDLVLPTAHTENPLALGQPQNWHFPAKQLTYCTTNDTTCSQCTQQNYWLSPGQANDSRFCVGSMGCICVANCARNDSAIRCPMPSPKVVDDDSHEDYSGLKVFLFCVLVLGLVVLVTCIWCLCKCINRRREKAETIQVARLVSDEEVARHADTASYVVVRPA